MLEAYTSDCSTQHANKDACLLAMSVNIEGISAAKEKLLANICEDQDCDISQPQSIYRTDWDGSAPPFRR